VLHERRIDHGPGARLPVERVRAAATGSGGRNPARSARVVLSIPGAGTRLAAARERRPDGLLRSARGAGSKAHQPGAGHVFPARLCRGSRRDRRSGIGTRHRGAARGGAVGVQGPRTCRDVALPGHGRNRARSVSLGTRQLSRWPNHR
jgi:hypothetical protein